MTEDSWLAVLLLFFLMPTILLSLRIYFDTSRYLRNGYLASSVISLMFAIACYFFFAIGCGMTFYRSRRRLQFMDRVPNPDLARGGEGRMIAPMQALGQPLREATILHSYIVPTGLWLCKASFVAMYFNLKRHLNPTIKKLLYATIAYLAVSYLALILTHALWCGRIFGKQWAHTSQSHCTPFTQTLSISIYAVMNISSDILVLAIPLVIFHYISLPPREKYAIFFLLFLGTATIATTATCCALHITYRSELLMYYSFIQLAELLACIELSVAVCAVSLPSLKAVLYRKRERRRMRGESKRSTIHTATTATTSTSPDNSERNTMEQEHRAPEEDAWEEEYERANGEDDGRLVIMRRVSYEVASSPVDTPSPLSPLPAGRV